MGSLSDDPPFSIAYRLSGETPFRIRYRVANLRS
jgi:hypothetical protein